MPHEDSRAWPTAERELVYKKAVVPATGVGDGTTRGRSDHVAKIAEAVVIGVGGDLWVELQAVSRQ
jgi:hypothetical protein